MDALTMAGRRLSTLQQDEYVDAKGFNKHRSLINCILRLLHNFLQAVKVGEPLTERKKALHAATLMLPQNQARMGKLIASGYSPRLWDNAGRGGGLVREVVKEVGLKLGLLYVLGSKPLMHSSFQQKSTGNYPNPL